MSRFRLQDLLFGFTLVALGLGSLAFLVWHSRFDSIYANFVCWVGGGALVGSGLLKPLGWGLEGALFGAALQALLFIYVLSHAHPL